VHLTWSAARNPAAGVCFAGHCDWRLPTIVELQTILLAPNPCGSFPWHKASALGGWENARGEVRWGSEIVEPTAEIRRVIACG